MPDSASPSPAAPGRVATADLPDGSAPAVPRIVIVGAGFAGLAVAQGLAGAPAEVTVIDRHNHHLFQPLLYQVASAALSPADIAAPVRGILRRQKNAAVHLATVERIDRARRLVITDHGAFAYDRLVIATGAGHSYFGHDEWAAHAPGLKTIADAVAIRRRVLLAFEAAEEEPDAARRAALLTFVVVGGGPTGVELAGALAELARNALVGDFRRIAPEDARILLVEAGPRLLPSFPAGAGGRAARDLERLGVELRLGQAVTAIDAAGVRIGDDAVAASVTIWAAGVRASPAAQWLGVEPDRAGRVRVAPDLSLPDDPAILVLGDTALVGGADGKPVPGTAQAAKQQGRYAARRIAAALTGAPPPGAFRYRSRGEMATIGRNRAVAQIGRLRFDGFIGWLLWSLVHIALLIGFRNRVVVAFEWLWAYLTWQRGARLIPDP